MKRALSGEISLAAVARALSDGGGGGELDPAVQVERELSGELASAVGRAPFGELAPALGGPGGGHQSSPPPTSTIQEHLPLFA